MLAKRIIGRTKREPSTWRIALFEILIIIVGILLSVLITDWFSNRKDGKREHAYLEAIAQDLTADLEFLESDLQQREGQLEACVTLGRLGQQGSTMEVAPELAKSLTTLGKTVRFNPNMATFRALESTGRIELIENDAIVRNLIMLYSRYYDLVEQNNSDVSLYRNNFFLPFMLESFDFAAGSSRPPDTNPLPLRTEDFYRQMSNHVIYNQLSLSSTVVAYYTAIAYVRETLALVKTELE
jgi:hypothetical protein